MRNGTLDLDVPTKLTEAVVLELLRAFHNKPGNGGNGEYAFLTHVRNDAAFGASRTFDAVALNLWPSRGLALHVYEVKVSRSDWQRELSKPDKAEDAMRLAQRFSIVAPVGCVRDGELPEPWGLIEVRGDGDTKPWKLKTVKEAPHHGGPAKDLPLPRGFVVAMMRACPGAVPGGKVPPPTADALSAEYERGVKHGETNRSFALEDGKRAVADAAALRDALVAAGLNRYEATVPSLVALAPAIVAAKRGSQIDTQLDHARRALAFALEALGESA